MVHRPVEVLGLAGVGVPHGNPGVRGQQARSVRLPRFGERAAGPHQHPGQGVYSAGIIRHG